MNQLTTYLVNHEGVNPWVYTGAVFAAIFAIGFFIKGVVWSRLTRYAQTTDSRWDDMVVAHLSAPLNVLIFIGAFGIAGQSAPPDVRSHPLMRFGVKIAVIVVVLWMVNRALSFFFRSSALPDTLTTTTRSLFLTIARVVLGAIGLLIVLDTIGVSITPLLASLGVGSVAVALALQDTLSNFFGGLYILVDKPIRLGDFVKIGDDQGYVENIGWRSTRIRLLANNVVFVPNSKVASSPILNFELPNRFVSMTVDVGVGYESDLKRVEQIVIEVARDVVTRVPGGNPQGDPACRFHTFADSSINFTASLPVARFEDIAIIKHEFIKALHERFIRERVSIPFPQRVVWTQAIPAETGRA